MKKCEYIGCNCKGKENVKLNWGKNKSVYFCENHKPDWLKAGLKESPKATLFGITKSFYIAI